MQKTGFRMKISSYIIIAVLVCYIIAVTYNIITINNIAEREIQENSYAIGLELVSRLGIGQTLRIFGNLVVNPNNATTILRDERITRELVSVLMDWYAPIKWSPVLNVSKEIYTLIAQIRVKSSTSISLTSTYAHVQSVALNIRSGPSVNHDIIGRLSRNARVQVLNKSGTWWRIRTGSIEGYVNSNYLGNN